MAEKRVYFFGGGKADGNTKMKECPARLYHRYEGMQRLL
jgi:hypothetical protein